MTANIEPNNITIINEKLNTRGNVLNLSFEIEGDPINVRAVSILRDSVVLFIKVEPHLDRDKYWGKNGLGDEEAIKEMDTIREKGGREFISFLNNAGIKTGNYDSVSEYQRYDNTSSTYDWIPIKLADFSQFKDAMNILNWPENVQTRILGRHAEVTKGLADKFKDDTEALLKQALKRAGCPPENVEVLYQETLAKIATQKQSPEECKASWVRRAAENLRDTSPESGRYYS
jgi:hypothetical protein